MTCAHCKHKDTAVCEQCPEFGIVGSLTKALLDDIKTSKPRKPKPPLETAECKFFVEYLEALKLQEKVKLFSKLTQETYTKSWGIKNRNKAEGLRKGVPDYLIITGNDKLVFLEMKRVKGGVVSDEQEEWVKAIQDTGTYCFIAYGVEAAIKCIESVVKP